MTITSTSIIKKLLVVFLVLAGVYFARGFLVPFAIATVLATLFRPVCSWLEARKIPKALAAIACLLLLLGAIAGIVALLGYQVNALMQDIALIKQKSFDIISRLQQHIFNYVGIPIERQMRILSSQQAVASSTIRAIAGSAAGILSNSLLMLVYIVLLLFYRGHIRQFLLKLSPSKHDETNALIDNVAGVSQQYLVGLSKMIVCLWVMYGIAFSLLGVKNAIFFAFLCGILEIIPFVGNITGTAITVLVAAVQGGSTGMLLGIVGSYGIIQFVQGWLLEPLIVGKQVKVNPLFTIIALVVGELVWGIAGVFLAIPLMAMLKIVCDNVDPLKPYGFLIGDTEKSKSAKRRLDKSVDD